MVLAIAITAAVALLALAAAHLAIGWWWASGFFRSALRPRSPSRGFGVFVSSVDRKTIVLTSKEPRQDIGHPGTLGIYWEDGYGQVGDVVDVADGRITRVFRVIEGDAPPIGVEVDLEAYAFPSDPTDVGLAFHEAEYPTELGPTAAWVVPAGDGARWAIHVHGWTAERREAIRLLPSMSRAGITSMVIDYRNDPGAPGDPTGIYRFGLGEWKDVESAVRYALDHDAGEVILVGYSTGAAHVMSFLERSPDAGLVVGVVLDSPNVILAETVRAGTRGLHLGPTPIPVTTLMTEFGMWIADLRWKIDWDQTNYVQRGEDILQAPTLVFHGTSDHRVPISVSRQLEARAKEVVTLIETPAAGHVMSWNADPERYERYLDGFLDRI